MGLAGNPATRSQILANRLTQVNSALIESVEQCSDADWHVICPDEERTVGVTAHHVATIYRATIELAQAVASGQPVPPLTMELLHRDAAQHAEQYAACTQAETAALLHQNGAAAASAIRALSEEHLKRAARIPAYGDRPVSVEWLIDYVLIAHSQEHLRSIHAAIGH